MSTTNLSVPIDQQATPLTSPQGVVPIRTVPSLIKEAAESTTFIENNGHNNNNNNTTTTSATNNTAINQQQVDQALNSSTSSSPPQPNVDYSANPNASSSSSSNITNITNIVANNTNGHHHDEVSINMLMKRETTDDDADASQALSSIMMAPSKMEQKQHGDHHDEDDDHQGLMGIAALASQHQYTVENPIDHVSDSDNEEDEYTINNANRVSDLYSLLREEDSDNDGEGNISSLPPQQLMMDKIASSSPAMMKQQPSSSSSSTPTLESELLLANSTRVSRRKSTTSTSTASTSTTSSTRGKGRGSRGGKKGKAAMKGVAEQDPNLLNSSGISSTSAMEDEEIADAGAMENDDDEYVAEHDEDDEEMPQQLKRRGSRRRTDAMNTSLTSPNPNNDEAPETEILSEDELMHCVVCKRSNLQVNFKKNYTINTNNYKTYCDTFPFQSEIIPKPKDGESLSVCSTCYNKQWRFARGQYDPYKNRAVNKREGLKKPPKLKDSPRLGDSPNESNTPTMLTPSLGGVENQANEEESTSGTLVTSNTKRKVKRKVDEDPETKKVATENPEDETGQPKKKVKRALKAKKAVPPPPTGVASIIQPVISPPPSIVNTNNPISSAVPSVGTSMVMQSNLVSPPSGTPKRGRKTKGNNSAIGIASPAPASSVKKEEPVVNTSLLIVYCKRVGNSTQDETIYSTKIVTPHCPETVDQIRELVMERLTQKKGDVFSFDCAFCNSVDRFNNSIKVEIDDFFFKDVKLKDDDSLCVYVNDKQ